jgi:hypothetical protein
MKRSVALLITALAILAPFADVHPCSANAAAPPSVIIIVPDAPRDLEITLEPGHLKAMRTDKVVESYFAFYSFGLQSTETAVKVSTGASVFEIPLGSLVNSYNNIFTLDIEKQTLTPGKPLFFTIALPTVRIILTLAIESLVFFLFGYRSRRSWAVFCIANAITLAFINIWFIGSFAPLESYATLSLMFGEFLVFIFELIAFSIFVNEHSRWRTAGYVMAANLLSWIIGGYLITILPV